MDRSIWLAHHPPEDSHRCARFGSLRVCRRCLVAWPVAIAVLVLGVARGHPLPGLSELVAWWSLPLAEFVAVHALGRPYSARRTWVLGIILGVALGRTLSRTLWDPVDGLAWAVLGTVAMIGGVSATLYHCSVKNRESV